MSYKIVAARESTTKKKKSSDNNDRGASSADSTMSGMQCAELLGGEANSVGEFTTHSLLHECVGLRQHDRAVHQPIFNCTTKMVTVVYPADLAGSREGSSAGFRFSGNFLETGGGCSNSGPESVCFELFSRQLCEELSEMETMLEAESEFADAQTDTDEGGPVEFCFTVFS